MRRIARRKRFRVEYNGHFIDAWHNRIGQATEKEIRKTLHMKLKRRVAYSENNSLYLTVKGRKALFYITPWDTYRFVTVLDRGMKIRGFGG